MNLRVVPMWGDNFFWVLVLAMLASSVAQFWYSAARTGCSANPYRAHTARPYNSKIANNPRWSDG